MKRTSGPLGWLASQATSNIPYKVLSVLIAVALWFIVRDERVETSTLWSLELQVPPELVVSNEALPELNVGVAGTRVALDRLKREPLVDAIRLKTAEPGIFTLHIRPEDLHVPRGVEVVHVSPSTIAVRLETRASRRVVVRPRIVLEEDSAWRVKKATLTPDHVRLEGPQSIVAAVDQVWTEALAVPPKNGETITQKVAISMPHPQLRADPPTVTVSLELEPVAAPAASPGASGAKPTPTPSPSASKAKGRAESELGRLFR